ncbi:hypothetical protein AB0D14_21930 [Streptomyces sp. NPDC048484]|uniref:hypothetical protein n=1 Tax=Streptomyces sp. NPDC048484 TaxID=3155146 RepID=UPI0034276430
MKEAVHIGKNPSAEPVLQDLIGSVALGAQHAFTGLYDVVADPAFGVVHGVPHGHAPEYDEVTEQLETRPSAPPLGTVKAQPLGTVKTRPRDGRSRRRDCLGVTV